MLGIPSKSESSTILLAQAMVFFLHSLEIIRAAYHDLSPRKEDGKEKKKKKKKKKNT